MSKNTFCGGVHPYEGKELSNNAPLTPYLPQGDLIFLLSQHIGKPAQCLVKKNDKVLAGQIIGQADGFVSANIISSVSGKVKAVQKCQTAMGTSAMGVIIENDGEYTLAEGIGVPNDIEALSNKDIIDKVKAAGIVGMGGAGFPTHVKLMPKNPDGIEYIIANGAECEPYITCDDQLMRTKASEIVKGVEILLRLFPKAQGMVLIEENKPEAIAAMQAACQGSKVTVKVVQTKYPQGGERSIISVITGKHLKLGLLPADLGCIVDNVSTVYAIYRAVAFNEPLMERNFTVSGEGIAKPSNYIVKVGTVMEELVEASGGFKEGTDPKKLLSGGPMMGMALANLQVPVCKNNNALTVLVEDPVEKAQLEMTACLRCGRCNHACPEGLTPQQMAVAAERKDYERYEKKLYGLECIACGSCTFICPARRPLMQLFKQTKAEIMAAKRRG